MTEAQIEQQKREKRIEELGIAYSEVFKGKNGELVYNHLKDHCGWEVPTIRKVDPVDPLAMAYFEGQRSVFGMIQTTVKRERKNAKAKATIIS